MADPGVEGEAFVTGEAPRLSGRGGIVIDVGSHDQNKDENRKSIDAAGRHRLLEDVNELKLSVSMCPKKSESRMGYTQGSRWDHQVRRLLMEGRRGMLLG